MKKMKKVLIGCGAAAMLAVMPVTAYAKPAYDFPAEAAAGVTGKTLDEVTAMHHSGRSYGAIAQEAGKLEEFQQAALDSCKEALGLRVTEGTLTQEQADAILAEMVQRQAQCDGSGRAAGACKGTGRDCGYKSGAGRQSGSCLYR